VSGSNFLVVLPSSPIEVFPISMSAQDFGPILGEGLRLTCVSPAPRPKPPQRRQQPLSQSSFLRYKSVSCHVDRNYAAVLPFRGVLASARSLDGPSDPEKASVWSSTRPENRRTVITLLKKPVFAVFERTLPHALWSSTILRVPPCPNTARGRELVKKREPQARKD
jgi:hypothetical protein